MRVFLVVAVTFSLVLTAVAPHPVYHDEQTTPVEERVFWHITDIHLDPWYTPGQPPGSSCHCPSIVLNRTDICSDPPISPVSGLWGAPLTFTCDSPHSLLDLTLKSSKQIAPEPLFVVVTGDLARHDSNIEKTWDENLRIIRTVTTSITDVWSQCPILMCLGNNDIYPHNVVQPRSPFLSEMGDIWKSVIPDHQLPAFKNFGWYTVPLTANLTGVSINTMFMTKSNRYAADCMQDPNSPGAEHIQWLEADVFPNALARQQKVLIAGHVPPSANDWYPGCLEAYARVVTKYSNTITGQLFGHVNLDHFVFVDPIVPVLPTANRHQVPFAMADTVPRPTAHERFTEQMFMNWLRHLNIPRSVAVELPPVAIVSPSVVPNYYPSLRLFKVNPSATAMLDYTQYLLNLTETGQEPQYTVEYSARSAYGLRDLSSHSYRELALALMTPATNENATRLHDTFWRYFTVSTGVS